MVSDVALNTSMDGLLNNPELFREFGVFVTTFGDSVGIEQLTKLFERENPDYRLQAVDLERGITDYWNHGSIFLGHNSNKGLVSVLLAGDGDSGPNIFQTSANDSLYIPFKSGILAENGNLKGLRMGYSGNDAEAANYTLHLPHLLLATDPVLPDFGCGDKKNHYTKWSVYQQGRGRIPAGDPRLKELPEGMLRPNFSEVYGAHFVSPSTSRVHSHPIGEIYFGGDGILFVYDHKLKNVVALELSPDTVLYLSKEYNGWPPKHGAVARDLGNPQGVWVIVPGEWQAETFHDTPEQIKPTKQHDGRVIEHPGKVIEDRLPRPMNERGQRFAAEEFTYTLR